MRDFLKRTFTNDELVDVYRQNMFGIELWKQYSIDSNTIYERHCDEIWDIINREADELDKVTGQLIGKILIASGACSHVDLIEALVTHAARRIAYELTSNLYNCEKD